MRLIGFAGWSGAGKTTLIVKLIPVLRARGLSVSTIKHAHHDFDIDKPGKDSYEHRMAGATEVLIASDRRFALMHELRGEPAPSLATLVGKLARIDLVIVEGFKRDAHSKLEVYRAGVGKPLLYPEDSDIKAVVGDVRPRRLPENLAYAAIDDVAEVANLVLQFAMPWP